MTEVAVPETLLLREVISIYNALAIVKGSTTSTVGMFSCISIRNRLKPVLDAIDEINKEPESIIKFNEEKKAICIEFSEKDVSGEPILIQKPGSPKDVFSYKIDQNKAIEFSNAMKLLSEKYNSDVKAYSKHMEDMRDMLNAPSAELKPGMLSMLKLSWFKPDVNPEAMEALFPIIINDL